MKFKEYKYERPDIKKLESDFDILLEEFRNSESAEGQYEILKKINLLRKGFESMRSISNIRYTVNTKDKFYDGEHEYFDNNGPVYAGSINRLYKTLLGSKFRKELEEKTGTLLFSLAELSLKTFNPDIIDDLKKENQLVTEYVKLIASAKINFEGEERNISGIAPFLQSQNRQVRKNAAEAKWKFFEENEKTLDRIYDELVKIRTHIARKLGYENFIQLGYDRMRRSDYTHREVKEFRNAVKEFIVPVSLKLKEMKRKRVGLDKLHYYDEGFSYKGGNPVPKGSPEWIVDRAKIMYDELSEDTGKFFKFMTERELLDLYNRKDKAAGGYCTFIPEYESPFIFSNMNGTSDDIRVLTHEAGHAFQAFESKNYELPEYRIATMESAEIHSMSMEFITWPWMQLFFEEDTDKFLYAHLSRALSFVPYGVSVDEFQHYVYENPDASPEDRKKKWREIEKKYRPYMNYEENEFLERGGYWFQQAHIFKMPFYYIDYCLAQICALQFWRKCNHDRDIAWKDYLDLCKAGGSRSFLDLLKIAKIDSPFDKKVIESIVKYCEEWIVSVGKEFDLAEAD
ncbi:MAG TPA: M3 family oligoendopeptidase [Ignavibacteria bacterium]|nr:M3 family oligoendopeptidase [Ignavibacteria bacterium]